MHWTKILLIVSCVVFVIAAFYASVTFYRLHQPAEQEIDTISEKPSVPVQKDSQVKKDSNPPTVSDESPEIDSEISDADSPPTIDSNEGNSAVSDTRAEDAFNRFIDEDSETTEYPEVSPDYPFTVVWKLSEEEKARITDLDQHILLNLVMIKLWNEGDHDFVGATISHKTGKVYPLYEDVAYVTWDKSKRPDGTIYRYVGSVLTGATVDSDKISDQLNNGEIPEGIKIVDYASAGIDPFEFLSK